jgi:hypothetical protein
MANIMFKTLGIRVSLVVCGALSGGVIVAQQPADGDQRMRIDVSALGPQVGERVPDFSLQDQNGQTRDLQSIMGPKGAMLVFVRSVDW